MFVIEIVIIVDYVSVYICICIHAVVCGYTTFWGECWWGWRHFCAFQACLGYGSAPGPNLKKGIVGHATNTWSTYVMNWWRIKEKKEKVKKRKKEGKENRDSACTWPTERRNPKLLKKKKQKQAARVIGLDMNSLCLEDRNRVGCTFISTLFVQLFLKSFFYPHQIRIRSVWTIDSTLTGTTTPNQDGPGSNDNKEVLFRSGTVPSGAVWSSVISLSLVG